MFGVCMTNISRSNVEKDNYFLICHMLENLKIPNMFFNPLKRTVDVVVDGEDELSIARLKKLFNQGGIKDGISVAERRLKSGSSVVFGVTVSP